MHVKVGYRVEIQLTDGEWHLGVITDAAHNESTPIWFIRLDDGRPAICCSIACIRGIKK